MKSLFEALADLIKTDKPVALSIIVKTEGATPRKVGTKIIIFKDGGTLGTMGGGDLEKRVIAEAIEAIKQGEPRLISFTLDIEKGKLDMMCGGKLDVYIEPILPKEKLIIFGAGHITRALAPLMQKVGFKVSVVDNSPDLLQKEYFPEIEDLKLMDMEQEAKDLKADLSTYIVILSRGFSKDEVILSQLIQKGFKYIGMVGSQRKIRTMEEELQKQGVSKEALSKLQAPIGVDIGAETPEEIAISIAAEIIATKRGRLNRFITQNIK